ncbi:unnamed protein product [Lupinus luteus]|uniref:Uncharacterized protein n=1 Tax=Lupinus luteus TaxID=3873 RepID=A0AAV1WJK5_LUPLU
MKEKVSRSRIQDREERKSLCFDRKKRLAEMKETTKILRFGSMVLILGYDFIREVSQAPSDVWYTVKKFAF